MKMQNRFTVKREFLVDLPTRWINQFFTLSCAADICRLYPDAKEVTESIGAFEALKKVGLLYSDRQGDNNTHVLVPGDGVSPRTGVQCAFRTNWITYSVDPLIRNEGYEPTYNGIIFRRLTCIKDKVENIEPIDCNNGIGTILQVHSHAELQDCVDKMINYKELHVVTLECCVKQRLLNQNGKEIKPDIKYNDPNIWSPKNEVKIWKITKGE